MRETNAVRAIFETYYKGAVLKVTGWKPQQISTSYTPKIPVVEEITIKQLKLGGHRFNGAIVFVVLTPSSDEEIICKVYDNTFAPRSDSDSDSDSDGDSEAPLLSSTVAFDTEKKAYQKLSSKPKITSGINPEYYGCGKIKLNSGDEWPIILLEHVRGQPPHRVTSLINKPSRKQRKRIMRKLIEADSDILFHANVRHNDLAPRNVIIETETMPGEGGNKTVPGKGGNKTVPGKGGNKTVPGKGGNKTEKIPKNPRVCLVDFAQSTYFTKNMEKRYQNPLFRWTNRVEEWTSWGWLDSSGAEEWMWGKGSRKKGYPGVQKDDKNGWVECVRAECANGGDLCGSGCSLPFLARLFGAAVLTNP
ncbi:hypothetical protein BU26DRAFT_546778 [Trematosphaeria pertusa]|uniref:Uncharacterized protein n=1 Tax=Trematosphaeria pertusa TaxID=390896 RepID=A0A6A6IVX8_9PLEO|nr:uncharacterized protein BU26DRAFT_546778 [Trematosphaeria pertusa]KAF2254589.1 hypothetical protein BU26DRAFT_546778 [Trematosphaeria pertusa]